MSNELTFAHLTIVAMGSSSRLETLTIPMVGVQSNKPRPRSLRQLDLEDLL